MNIFVSDISRKKFPRTDRVAGKTIRPPLLQQIKKEFPDFREDWNLSVTELNEFRRKYISSLREGEASHLTELEQKVLDSFDEGNTLVDKVEEVQGVATLGERLSDKVASFGGSWTFVIIFMAVLLGWLGVNIFSATGGQFDPYPFILLNLVLSSIAALQAPIIIMSQNRQEAKDRERAKKDYMINLQAELEVRLLNEKMNHLILRQQKELIEMQEIQVDMMNDILEKKTNKRKTAL